MRKKILAAVGAVAVSMLLFHSGRHVAQAEEQVPVKEIAVSDGFGGSEQVPDAGQQEGQREEALQADGMEMWEAVKNGSYHTSTWTDNSNSKGRIIVSVKNTYDTSDRFVSAWDDGFISANYLETGKGKVSWTHDKSCHAWIAEVKDANGVVISQGHYSTEHTGQCYTGTRTDTNYFHHGLQYYDEEGGTGKIIFENNITVPADEHLYMFHSMTIDLNGCTLKTEGDRIGSKTSHVIMANNYDLSISNGMLSGGNCKHATAFISGSGGSISLTDVTFKNMTHQNSSSKDDTPTGSAFVYCSGNLMMKNCTVNNSVDGDGRLLTVLGNGSVATIENCTIKSKCTKGIAVDEGRLVLKGTNIINGGGEGAGLCMPGDPQKEFELYGNTEISNCLKTGDSGAGILLKQTNATIYANASLTVRNCSANGAEGGGMSLLMGTVLQNKGSINIKNNQTNRNGGGIYIGSSLGGAKLINSGILQVTENTAQEGAGIETAVPAMIDNLQGGTLSIWGNKAAANAGGAKIKCGFNNKGTCQVYQNSAGSFGNALFLEGQSNFSNTGTLKLYGNLSGTEAVYMKKESVFLQKGTLLVGLSASGTKAANTGRAFTCNNTAKILVAKGAVTKLYTSDADHAVVLKNSSQAELHDVNVEGAQTKNGINLCDNAVLCATGLKIAGTFSNAALMLQSSQDTLLSALSIDGSSAMTIKNGININSGGLLLDKQYSISQCANDGIVSADGDTANILLEDGQITKCGNNAVTAGTRTKVKIGAKKSGETKIKGNGKNGIENRGTLGLYNDKVLVAGNEKYGVINSGSMFLEHGIIEKNGEYGIYNKENGEVTQSGGEVRGNGHGVYQGGIYYMKGQAYIDKSNEMYLPEGHYVTVTDTLTTDSQDEKTVLAPQYYYLGRVLVHAQKKGMSAESVLLYGNDRNKEQRFELKKGTGIFADETTGKKIEYKELGIGNRLNNSTDELNRKKADAVYAKNPDVQGVRSEYLYTSSGIPVFQQAVQKIKQADNQAVLDGKKVSHYAQMTGQSFQGKKLASQNAADWAGSIFITDTYEVTYSPVIYNVGIEDTVARNGAYAKYSWQPYTDSNSKNSGTEKIYTVSGLNNYADETGGNSKTKKNASAALEKTLVKYWCENLSAGMEQDLSQRLTLNAPFVENGSLEEVKCRFAYWYYLKDCDEKNDVISQKHIINTYALETDGETAYTLNESRTLRSAWFLTYDVIYTYCDAAKAAASDGRKGLLYDAQMCVDDNGFDSGRLASKDVWGVDGFDYDGNCSKAVSGYTILDDYTVPFYAEMEVMEAAGETVRDQNSYPANYRKLDGALTTTAVKNGSVKYLDAETGHMFQNNDYVDISSANEAGTDDSFSYFYAEDAVTNTYGDGSQHPVMISRDTVNGKEYYRGFLGWTQDPYQDTGMDGLLDSLKTPDSLFMDKRNVKTM